MRTIISNMRTARMAMMFILAMLTTLTVQAAADKTALDAAVSEAETYNSSILESNPKQAEVLTMLINSCTEGQRKTENSVSLCPKNYAVRVCLSVLRFC